MSRSDYKNIYEGYLDNTGYNNRNIRERYGSCGSEPMPYVMNEIPVMENYTGYNNRNIRERYGSCGSEPTPYMMNEGYGGCGTSPVMEKYNVNVFNMPHVKITSNNKTYVIGNYRSMFSGSYDYVGYVSAEGVTEKFTLCSKIRSLTDTGITTITAKFMDPLDTASGILKYPTNYIPRLFANSIDGPLVENVTISFDKEELPTKIIYTINGCGSTFVAPPPVLEAPTTPAPTTPAPAPTTPAPTTTTAKPTTTTAKPTTTLKTKVTENLSIFPNRSSWKLNDKLVMKDGQTNNVLRGSITTIYSSAASGKLSYDITFTNNIKKFYQNMPTDVRADMSNGSPDTSLLIWS